MADAGYCNESDLACLEERGVDGLCGFGPGGQQSGGGQRQGASGAGADGQQAGDVRRSRRSYAKRKWLSEAPNGWIKQAVGFRRFSVRGLNQAQGEWALVCLALNMKRMQGLAAA